MSTSLKYKPAAYKRLAEIAGWLAAGENVQWRKTGTPGFRWIQYDSGWDVEQALKHGMDFRIKPKKEPKCT